MPKRIFMQKKANFVNSFIFLQVLHNDASSTLNIDPIYCTHPPPVKKSGHWRNWFKGTLTQNF